MMSMHLCVGFCDVPVGACWGIHGLRQLICIINHNMIEYIPATCNCYYYDFVLLSGLLRHTPFGVAPRAQASIALGLGSSPRRVGWGSVGIWVMAFGGRFPKFLGNFRLGGGGPEGGWCPGDWTVGEADGLALGRSLGRLDRGNVHGGGLGRLDWGNGHGGREGRGWAYPIATHPLGNLKCETNLGNGRMTMGWGSGNGLRVLLLLLLLAILSQ